MNKKGFTLTEIIGAIIILGILVIIVVVAVTRNMSGFREDYYTSTSRTLTESGKEFFNDNRRYRPRGVLEGQIVPISTLISQHYIAEVKDYQGNNCSNNSYVIVIKNGKDDYTYHTCLVCPGDNYSNMDDKYCDSAWTNSTTIEYAIETPPRLYVYRNTDRESLKELLAIKASYVKKNSKGEVIGIVNGTGLDGSPTIYPDNFDNVDTTRLGEYSLNYTYQDKTVTGSVIVYEFGQPGVGITKETEYAIDLNGGTLIDIGNYTSGEWTQKIHVTLTSGIVRAGTVDLTSAKLKNIVHKYQWNKDGVWQDFCGGDDCANIIVTTEMNEDIKFRSIDVNGVISEESEATVIRIDNTKPTCGLQTEGSHKGNDWFTSNVDVSFTSKEDIIKTSPEAVSGIRRSNITISSGTLPDETILNVTHEQDSADIKYIGFVEDNAKNFMLCEVTFKKDATDPSCSTTASPSGWTNSSVTIAGTCSDVTSKCVQNVSVTKSDETGANGASFSPGVVYDNAGNSKTCDNVTIYIDKTAPTCGTITYSDNSTSGVTATIACKDEGGSTCTGSAKTPSPVKISGSLTIKDKAGNSTTCDYKVSSYQEHNDHTYDDCKTGSPNECVETGTCWDPVDTTGSQDCYDNYHGVVDSSNGTCRAPRECCKRTANTCKGDWNGWNGWSRGRCTSANVANSYECVEQTVYYGVK